MYKIEQIISLVTLCLKTDTLFLLNSIQFLFSILSYQDLDLNMSVYVVLEGLQGDTYGICRLWMQKRTRTELNWTESNIVISNNKESWSEIPFEFQSNNAVFIHHDTETDTDTHTTE